MSRANEPAFPANALRQDTWTHRPGMTLREYYAGMAMQGILSDRAGDLANGELTHFVERFATEAVVIADALIAALETP